MVGEDEAKLTRYAKMGKTQEKVMRLNLEARGIKLPGRRASGHIFYVQVDEQFAKGEITSLEAERLVRERDAERARRAEAKDTQRDGPNRVYEMFMREGEKLG